MESIIYPSLGGIIIGLAAAVVLLTLGRIMGVSGILAGLLQRKADRNWRLFFLAGMLLGAVIIEKIGFSVMAIETSQPLHLLIPGGLLVGIGTTVGSGCTSGHGVCGIGRLSLRSLTATVIFVSSGILTVFILKSLGKI